MRSFKHPRTGKVITTSDNKALKPWRQQVSHCAVNEFRGFIFQRDVPVVVQATFYFTKPPSAKKRKSPTVKPDIDKLLRATLDALTGIAFVDDAQVVFATASKGYDTAERTHISIAESQ